jgi:hypothetical protein
VSDATGVFYSCDNNAMQICNAMPCECELAGEELKTLTLACHLCTVRTCDRCLAPEYFTHGIVDEKTDVFAFGVFLLELISGRKPVDGSHMSLIAWVSVPTGQPSYPSSGLVPVPLPLPLPPFASSAHLAMWPWTD